MTAADHLPRKLRQRERYRVSGDFAAEKPVSKRALTAAALMLLALPHAAGQLGAVEAAGNQASDAFVPPPQRALTAVSCRPVARCATSRQGQSRVRPNPT